MPKEVEMREGKESAERFIRLAKKVLGVPKSEIDKRAADEREKRQSENAESAE